MSATMDPKTVAKKPSNGNGAGGHDSQRNMILEGEKWRVLGTRPIRHDGADKVTGRALYGADIRLAGMVYGAVVRSPHAHARIISIDTSEAEKAQGVLAVVTAADFPEDDPARLVNLGEGPVPLAYARSNVLASGKVLY
jgi:CO/xanthine dehydrogenase Mo-binding subunit